MSPSRDISACPAEARNQCPKSGGCRRALVGAMARGDILDRKQSFVMPSGVGDACEFYSMVEVTR